MSDTNEPKTRQRGSIKTLASGSLRVRVYAGQDPLTKKRMYLEAVIPLKPGAPAKDQKAAWKRAKELKQDFIRQVDERRNPRTKATVNQMIDRYYDPKRTSLLIEKTTRGENIRNLNKHVRPVLGDLKLAQLSDPTIWDSFHAAMRQCRDHCNGRKYVDHRTPWPHECDDRCQQHQCKPLGEAAILRVHALLSTMLNESIRWGWISVNPINMAKRPTPPAPDPDPPSAQEMAKILNDAFAGRYKDFDWGVFLWLKARTGARRGEMCALRLNLLDLDQGTLRINTSIAQDGSTTWEKDTKTHQKRRVALSPEDVALLRAYLERRQHQADMLGVTINPNGRLFSPAPDHSQWLNPDPVSDRFDRLCVRVGVDTSIKNLRHYSATELIAAGTDIRTVAGRLGHSGGGVTTLKVYTAFTSEADQKAAAATSARMPDLPVSLGRLAGNEPEPSIPEDPEAPYEHIARDLAGAITAGFLKPGDTLPPLKQLADRYNVAVSTIHRAIELLKKDGLITASRGVPAKVTDTTV